MRARLALFCIVPLIVAGCGPSKAELMTIYQGEVKIRDEAAAALSAAQLAQATAVRSLEQDKWEQEREARWTVEANMSIAVRGQLDKENFVPPKDASPVEAFNLSTRRALREAELEKEMQSHPKYQKTLQAAVAKVSDEFVKKIKAINDEHRKIIAECETQLSERQVKVDAAKKRLDAK